MEPSHTRARRLIQFNADRSLRHDDKEILRAHLESCADCRHYADSLKAMESVMEPLMRRQWNLSPASLSIASLRPGKNKVPAGSPLLTTRIALIGLVCMVFLFSIWQVTFSSTRTPGLFTAAVPLIPTPSTNSTFTSTAQSCVEQSYFVQQNDTLERIAVQFATSKEEIIVANKLKTETLRPGATLWISVCTFTPTGTVNALTITYTPSLSPTRSTPGG